MTRLQSLDTAAPPLAIRGGRFEDVSAILGLIEGAIEHGCRDHYDATQRRVVFLGYASSLFVDALGPFALWTAEVGGGWLASPSWICRAAGCGRCSWGRRFRGRGSGVRCSRRLRRGPAPPAARGSGARCRSTRCRFMPGPASAPASARTG